MTSTQFDAPALKTRPRGGGRPPQTLRAGIAFRLVRVVWLAAIFARRESVSIADYRRRFGVSLRSFHRDVALLREAGFYLETIETSQYRMLCFDRYSDAP